MVLSSLGGACAGALSLPTIFERATGHEAIQLNAPAIRAAHDNSGTVYQAFGAVFGAAHAARTVPQIGRAHWRVVLGAMVGGAVGSGCGLLLGMLHKQSKLNESTAGSENLVLEMCRSERTRKGDSL